MTGTFEGVGSLQFSPDNKFCYIYSGEVDIKQDFPPKALLEFQTNSEYIVGKIILGRNDFSGDDIVLYVSYNNITIGAFGSNGYTDAADQDIEIIVPPFTTVKLAARNLSSDTNRDCFGLFTGKVGGAIEQENLEAITDNNKWASK